MMYCLTVFYKGVRDPWKTYGNEDHLSQTAQRLQDEKLIWAWRVVNVDSGTCVNYWKEGEVSGGRPAYRI